MEKAVFNTAFFCTGQIATHDFIYGSVVTCHRLRFESPSMIGMISDQVFDENAAFTR